MSNRDALRRLSKKFPPPKEVRTIMDALREESDLTAAIVAASLLESALEKFLISAMRTKEPRLLGKMFENRGPLSDFNGKILVAVAFGVITPELGDHFQTIRHVRNAFAHARVPISFETPQVRREIDGFGMLLAMKEVLASRGNEDADLPPIPDMPAKSGYLLIVTLILIILDHLYERAGQGNLYSADRPPAKASS